MKNDIKEFSKKLRELQSLKNSGRGVSTVRGICDYLDKDDVQTAKIIFGNDGDKLHAYPDIESMIEQHLGCRLHSKINCDNWLCTKVRKSREKKQ